MVNFFPLQYYAPLAIIYKGAETSVFHVSAAASLIVGGRLAADLGAMEGARAVQRAWAIRASLVFPFRQLKLGGT